MTTQDPKSCCSWLIWAVDHGRNMIYIYNIMIYPKSVNSTGQNFLKWNCWVLQLLWLGYPIGLLGCMFFSIIANAKKTQDHVLAGMMINRLIFTKIWSREKSREIERSRERVLCRTLKVHSETLKVHSETLKVHSETLKVHSETLKVNSAAIENREKSREIESSDFQTHVKSSLFGSTLTVHYLHNMHCLGMMCSDFSTAPGLHTFSLTDMEKLNAQAQKRHQ